MRRSSLYRLVALAILVVMFIPLLLNHIPGIPRAHVFGAEEKEAEKTTSWLDGTAQQQFEKDLMAQSVARTYLLRFRNQYQYSLFNRINAKDIYIYNDQYFRFYVPDLNEELNFKGQEPVDNTIKAMQSLMHQLGDSVPIITIIPPAKMHYYKELLPAIHKTNSIHTNYQYILNGLKENNMPFIDFNQYFLENKSEKPAIFAREGIHWTHYAATVASDSLIRFISQLKGVKYDAFEFSTIYNNGFNVDDLDLALLRNILVKPKDDNLRDVVVKPIKNEKRLNAVIIGDSYFLAINNSGVRKLIFTDNSNYHYYFNRSYNDDYIEIPFNTEKIIEEMKNADCIILINDVINLENFGFGFPQKINAILEKK